MAKLKVHDLKNKAVGEVEVSDTVFDYTASETLVWEAVRAFLAGRRKGTHKTKNRSEVRGGGAKPWKQKGTGRARAGSTRSPIWKKGGTVFGPKPRDYSQRLPKKKRRGAVRMVLSDKVRNDLLVVIDDFSLESHKTKNFVDTLKQFGLSGKVLLVDDRENQNLFLGSRNLPNVKMVPTTGVNVYDLLNHRHLLISKQAVQKLDEVLRPS